MKKTFYANPVQIPGTSIDRIDIHSLLQEEIVFFLFLCDKEMISHLL